MEEQSNTQERILVNGEEKTISIKSLNFLTHDGSVNLQCPDRYEINPITTLDFTSSLSADSWDSIRKSDYFIFSWNIITNHLKIPPTLSHLKNEGTGVKHIVGLICLISIASSTNKQPFLKCPETYLHPSWQANLADFFIFLSNPNQYIFNTLT